MHKLQDAKLHIPIYSTYVHTDVHSGQAGRHDLWKFVISCQKLLADAKIPKNIPQNLISRYLSDDRTEVVDGFADVLGGEVGREAGGEAFADAEEGSAGVCEGLDVALVCDQCCVAVAEEIALRSC